jgi:hypothetical protein
MLPSLHCYFAASAKEVLRGRDGYLQLMTLSPRAWLLEELSQRRKKLATRAGGIRMFLFFSQAGTVELGGNDVHVA